MESMRAATMANQVVNVDFQKDKLTETWKVGRSRKANDELRGKRHLTPAEIKAICKTLRQRSRHKDRDECMILVAFHHGLRVSELTNIKWQHIDLKTGQIAIKRLKNGIDTMHPISDVRELMLLKRLHQAQEKPQTGFVFRNERGVARYR
jgi:type 1 fimbriae regulatory protein FimB/type 1 fimbriae regulatory protein FimE